MPDRPGPTRTVRVSLVPQHQTAVHLLLFRREPIGSRSRASDRLLLYGLRDMPAARQVSGLPDRSGGAGVAHHCQG